MSDAVQSGGQDMEQEAADELLDRECHPLVSNTPLAPVVLPAEGNPALVERDEAAVGDRHPMGIAREVGQHSLGSGEGALGIDDPLALAQGLEPVGEDVCLGKPLMLTEELQLAGTVGNIVLDGKDLEIGVKNGNTGYQGLIDDYAIYNIALHEFGHIFGLDHKTPDQDSVIMDDRGIDDPNKKLPMASPAIYAAPKLVASGLSGRTTSAEMAGQLGAFPGYAKNADHMLRVMRNHQRAAHGKADGYDWEEIARASMQKKGGKPHFVNLPKGLLDALAWLIRSVITGASVSRSWAWTMPLRSTSTKLRSRVIDPSSSKA